MEGEYILGLEIVPQHDSLLKANVVGSNALSRVEGEYILGLDSVPQHDSLLKANVVGSDALSRVEGEYILGLDIVPQHDSLLKANVVDITAKTQQRTTHTNVHVIIKMTHCVFSNLWRRFH